MPGKKKRHHEAASQAMSRRTASHLPEIPLVLYMLLKRAVLMIPESHSRSTYESDVLSDKVTYRPLHKRKMKHPFIFQSSLLNQVHGPG